MPLAVLAIVGATFCVLVHNTELPEETTQRLLTEAASKGGKSHLTNESIIDTLNLMLMYVPNDRVKIWEEYTALTRHNLAYKKWIEEMDAVFSRDVSDDTLRKILRDPFLTTTDHTK